VLAHQSIRFGRISPPKNSAKFAVTSIGARAGLCALGRPKVLACSVLLASVNTYVSEICSKWLRLATDELPENFRPETTTEQLYALLSKPSTEAPEESTEGTQSRGGVVRRLNFCKPCFRGHYSLL
jgi:hypothetical protein